MLSAGVPLRMLLTESLGAQFFFVVKFTSLGFFLLTNRCFSIQVFPLFQFDFLQFKTRVVPPGTSPKVPFFLFSFHSWRASPGDSPLLPTSPSACQVCLCSAQQFFLYLSSPLLSLFEWPPNVYLCSLLNSDHAERVFDKLICRKRIGRNYSSTNCSSWFFIPSYDSPDLLAVPRGSTVPSPLFNFPKFNVCASNSSPFP